MTIQLGPERTEQASIELRKLVARKARIPGFRPGKAPYATVLRTYGREAVLSEIMDDLGEEVFKEALESEKIEPFGQAGLEDVQTESDHLHAGRAPCRRRSIWAITAIIRLETPAVSTSPRRMSTPLSRSNAPPRHAARSSSEPPRSAIRWWWTSGHGRRRHHHGQPGLGADLKGEGGWLPGFDESFVGMSAGDEKDFTLTYPEDSTSRYKGQTGDLPRQGQGSEGPGQARGGRRVRQVAGRLRDVADYRRRSWPRSTEERTAEAETKLNDEAVQALIDGATIAYPPTAVGRTSTT